MDFLRLTNNELTNLDVSKNILLRDLSVGNQLTSLDVSKKERYNYIIT